MGIFDKVSGLFKSKEDKKEKELSEIEVEKIIQKLDSAGKFDRNFEKNS